jgi:hypothetical protein
MFRPALQRDPYIHFEDTMTQAGVVLQMLCSALEAIFEVVEPVDANLTTYGHRLRHQLLVACTEVEAGWAGVLRANGYGSSGQLNTADYVKLADPLHLREYRVALRHYEHYPTLEPFRNWDAAAPTKTLPWYDAYNRAKHDREANFHRATLDNVVRATAAYYILTASQFNGIHFGHGASFRQDVFWFSAEPSLRADDYVPPEGTSWSPVDFPF